MTTETNWKPVSINAVDIRKYKDVPQIGKYLRKDQITTKLGPCNVWHFTNEDNRPYAIYGFTNLDRAMTNVIPGSLCRITYLGKQNKQTKFGMKDVHQVLVEIAENGQNVGTEEVPF